MRTDASSDVRVMVGYRSCGCPTHMTTIVDANAGLLDVLASGRSVSGFPLVCDKCHRSITATIIDPAVHVNVRWERGER